MTATLLGQRCGESSGLTSYHLRQLASAGFVKDAEPADLIGRRVDGRVRWWEAISQVTVTQLPDDGDEASAAASEDHERAVIELYTERARAWVVAKHTWPPQLQKRSSLGDRALYLTPTQVAALQTELTDLLARYCEHGAAGAPVPNGMPTDALVFSFQYQLFPDPEQTPPVTSDPDEEL